MAKWKYLLLFYHNSEILIAMAHIRRRALAPRIEKHLKYSGIVGVFGHRQVGKTTFVSSLSDRTYLTLDAQIHLNAAIEYPAQFLLQSKHSKMTIDECQLAPPLFPALKEYVRQDTRPGRFLLTGSVRFTSRKAIRESLTGRILFSDLLPMTLSEIDEAPIKDPCQISLKLFSQIQKISVRKTNEIIRYLETGGLPKVLFTRDQSLRHALRESYLDTILERDLKLIFPTSLSKRSLLLFFKVLAGFQGMHIDISRIAFESSLSRPTVKKLLAAFEALYLIRLIQSDGYSKAPKLFFEDLGERGYFKKNDLNQPTDLLACLYQNIRSYFYYLYSSDFRFFSFITKGGAEVPLAIETDECVLGFIPNYAGEATLKARRSAEVFLSAYGQSARVFLVSPDGPKRIVADDRICETPLGVWV